MCTMTKKLANNFLEELSNFSLQLTKEIDTIIFKYYQKDSQVKFKEDHTPVSLADIEIETFIQDKIKQAYPTHGIIGEELGETLADCHTEFTWIIDPIDGTKSFVSGVPLFGTLVGLLYQGKPVLGLIHNSILQETIIAYNQICLYNQKRLRINTDTQLEHAILVTSDHLNIGKYQDMPRFQKLLDKIYLYRTWGDCYAYSLLVRNFVHIAIDPVLSLWDCLPLIPILEAAGAKISNYHGQNILDDPSSLIAAPPALHEKILKILHS